MKEGSKVVFNERHRSKFEFGAKMLGYTGEHPVKDKVYTITLLKKERGKKWIELKNFNHGNGGAFGVRYWIEVEDDRFESTEISRELANKGVERSLEKIDVPERVFTLTEKF